MSSRAKQKQARRYQPAPPVKWEPLPALEGKPNPCMHCPPIRPALALDRTIAVGFGYAGVTRDGHGIWEEMGVDWEDCWTVARAESLAKRDPDHDWRIVMHGPMHGETYQRQGPASWVLVEKNEGFA